VAKRTAADSLGAKDHASASNPEELLADRRILDCPHALLSSFGGAATMFGIDVAG
jgi:hypothetical protein